MKGWQLKNAAKDKLTGNYSEAILLTTIYGIFVIVSSVLSTIIMSYSPNSQNPLLDLLTAKLYPTGYIIGLFFSVLSEIILNVLKAGVSLFYLNMACGQTYSIRDLFHAFREQRTKYLLIALILTFMQFFFALPGYACDYFYLQNSSDQWMLLSSICRVVGQIVVLPFNLAFAQVFRILLDYPSLSAIGALQKSWRLMKGHKFRLFTLMFSFLPLEIVAIFTFGIGYLWLNPYINMSYTLFYLDLMNPKES